MPGVDYRRKAVIVESRMVTKLVSETRSLTDQLEKFVQACPEPRPSEGLPKGSYWKSTDGLISIDLYSGEALISELELRLKRLRKFIR